MLYRFRAHTTAKAPCTLLTSMAAASSIACCPATPSQGRHWYFCTRAWDRWRCGATSDKVARRLGAQALVYSRFGYGQSDGLIAPNTPRFMHEEALDVLPRPARPARHRTPAVDRPFRRRLDCARPCRGLGSAGARSGADGAARVRRADLPRKHCQDPRDLPQHRSEAAPCQVPRTSTTLSSAGPTPGCSRNFAPGRSRTCCRPCANPCC